MHELALMESLVSAVEEELPTSRITAVWLEVGKLTCAMPHAMRFCFDVCARGTRLEGASLEIVEIDGLARCRTCNAEVAIEPPIAACACGSLDLEVVAGQEMRVLSVQVV
jgi:hydrogenase nickel incorporation protein HypA/HybF